MPLAQSLPKASWALKVLAARIYPACMELSSFHQELIPRIFYKKLFPCSSALSTQLSPFPLPTRVTVKFQSGCNDSVRNG